MTSDSVRGEPIRLMVGTGNDHKAREIAAILAGLPVVVFSARELPEFPRIEETGASFEENARLKARAFARSALQLEPTSRRPRWVLSDDSGLCVDALDDEPGVYSSRYASDLVEEPTDADNNRKLLQRLRDVPAKKRGARFVCALSLVEVPESADALPAVLLETRGECRGRIIDEARGDGGFGYDPLFLVEELGQTFAELPAEEKNRRSHRARALQRLRAALLERSNDLRREADRDTC